MARNPYAGSGGGSDPYTNGTGHGGPATGTAPGTDDYDPYGERYGTPPITTATAARDRRAARAGGYGNFYENSNGSSSSGLPLQSNAQPTQPEGYGSGTGEETIPGRSPRRHGAGGSGQSRRYRQELGAESSEGSRSRGPEYRRGAERQDQNESRSTDDVLVSRTRRNGISGGDGTRQIEG
jgi:hypothetical protein